MAAALAASVTAAVPLAQQAANAVTVPLTDAARVASLRLSLHSGNVIVRGSNRRDIAVSSSGADAAQDRRRADAPAGLRRLVQAPGLTITEANNEVTISARAGDETNVEVQVPSRINLKLTAHNSDSVVIEGTEGDIEVTNHNGDIRMTNVSGSVVANSHNGDVRITLTRVTAEKAMAVVHLRVALARLSRSVIMPQPIMPTPMIRMNRAAAPNPVCQP